MPEPQWDSDLIYVVDDLSGGLNDTVSEVNLEENEASLADNVNLDVDGAVGKRLGSTKLQGTTVGAGAKCNLALHFKPFGESARYVFAFGTDLYEWNGASLVSVYSGLDPDAIILAEPYKNLLYLNNNVDPPLVYWPSAPTSPKVFRSGTPRPATDPTFDSFIAGSIATNGVIKIRVRFVSEIDDIFFGDPAPAAGLEVTIAGAPEGVRINIPTHPAGAAPDHKVVKRIVERTKVDGGIYYRDGFVNDNTTTQYDLTQSDDDLELNPIMPADGFRAIPPTLYPFTTFKNRIVGWDRSQLGLIRWSEVDEFGLLPEAFDDNFFNEHQLDVNDALDEPVAIKPLGDYVIVYCGRSIHLLGIDAGGNSWARRLSGYNIGIPSARGVLEIPDGHIVWTFKGPYLFTAEQLTHIGERIEGVLKQSGKSKWSELFMVHLYDKRQVKVYLPAMAAQSQQNDAALVYHYRRQSFNPEGFPTRHAWTRHTGFTSRSGFVSRDEASKADIEITGDYDGFAYTEGVGDTDAHLAGGEIVASWRTGWWDFKLPMYVKDFLDIWVVTSAEASDKLKVSWECDFGAGPSGEAALVTTVEQPKFGTAIFGQSRFGAGDHLILHTQLAEAGVGAFGKYVRFLFQQEPADQTSGFSIIGIVLRYQVTRMRNDAAT